jgi:uncharacterized protein (TIGR02246 family)
MLHTSVTVEGRLVSEGEMDDEAAIRELLEQRYAACLSAGDVDAYSALYADDVIWAAPNMPDGRSRAEIATLLERLFSKVSQQLTVQVDDLTVTGDLAVALGIATGTVTRKPDGDAQPLRLRAMWVLRRDGTTWRISRQVGTPKPPA